LLGKTAARFDATDLSRAYLNIIRKEYKDDRKLAEDSSFAKLVKLLQINNYEEEKMKFVLRNWCVLLLTHELELRTNGKLKATLKHLFELKANGSEEDFISQLQRATELKHLIQEILNQYLPTKQN